MKHLDKLDKFLELVAYWFLRLAMVIWSVTLCLFGVWLIGFMTGGAS